MRVSCDTKQYNPEVYGQPYVMFPFCPNTRDMAKQAKCPYARTRILARTRALK